MIYLLHFSLCLFLSSLIDRASRGLQKIVLLLIVVMSAALFGLRDKSIGTDTSAYVWNFFTTVVHIPDYNVFWNRIVAYSDMEFLYKMWNYFASLFSHDFNVFLLFTGLFMYGIFFYVLYQERKEINFLFACYIFFFAFYNETFNALRQYMAMSFCMVGFSSLLKGKYKSSFLCTFIAYGFHHSAVLFGIIILLKKITEKYERFLLQKKAKIVFTCFLAYCLMVFSYILSFLEKIGLIEIKYIELYGNADVYGSSFPVSIFAFCVMNSIAFYFSKKRHDATSVFFEYLIISSVILCFSGLISVFATRINMYFLICTCIIIPYIFRNYIISSKIKFLYCLFLLVYWTLTIVVSNLGGTFPYKSNILGI